jgi:hypothetical protein
VAPSCAYACHHFYKPPLLINGAATAALNPPHRSRHLMSDFITLLPHSKKDVKLDTKSDRCVWRR